MPHNDRILGLSHLPAVYHTRTMVEDRRLREALHENQAQAGLLRQENIQWVVLRITDPQDAMVWENASDWGLERGVIFDDWILLRVR